MALRQKYRNHRVTALNAGRPCFVQALRNTRLVEEIAHTDFGLTCLWGAENASQQSAGPEKAKVLQVERYCSLVLGRHGHIHDRERRVGRGGPGCSECAGRLGVYCKERRWRGGAPRYDPCGRGF